MCPSVKNFAYHKDIQEETLAIALAAVWRVVLLSIKKAVGKKIVDNIHAFCPFYSAEVLSFSLHIKNRVREALLKQNNGDVYFSQLT